MRLKLILLLLIGFTLSIPAQVMAATGLASDLKTYSGKVISQDKDKITHLIFIDIWSSYEGLGDETVVAALPDDFLAQSQQIWLQPEINATRAQLAEFQQAFPQVTPLILDRGFNIMRSFKIWQSPYHILLKDGKREFGGSADELQRYIVNKYSLAVPETAVIKTPEQDPADVVVEDTATIMHSILPGGNKYVKSAKPLPGDKAPEFSMQALGGKRQSLSATLAGLKGDQPLSIVFVDTLCPMPQFPGCEQKLEQLNRLVANNPERQWLAVFNSYYVSEDYAMEFAKKFALKLPLVFDQGNKIFKAYDVYATPYQIDINRDGLIESRGDQLH